MSDTTITATKKKKNALKGKGGLITMAVLALLGVWLYFDFQKPVREADAKPLVAEYVHMNAADVVRAELKRPQGGFTLVKQGGKWAFEAPGKHRANPESVNNWLKATLDDANVAETVEGKPSDLGAIGFNNPEYQLILTGKGGETRTLQIGGPFRTTVGGEPTYYYAREAKDGRLFMLSLFVSDNLRIKKIDELRDKRLAEVTDDKAIQKIVLQRPNAATEVQRRGDDGWELVQPFKAPAEKFDVEGLTSAIKSAEADSFVEKPSGNMAEYGLDQPRLTVQVTDKKGQYGFVFGKETKDGKVYATRQGDPEVLLVAKSTFDNLNKLPADLREKKLLSLDRDKITYLELRNPWGTTQLQKSGTSEWTLVNPADPKQKKGKADMVQRVLDTVTGSASAFVEETPQDLAKYGLDKPTMTVTANEGTGTSQVLSIGKKTASGNYYAKGPGTAVFEIQSFIYADLNVKPEAFVDKSAPAK